jgi:hypothetical protein
VPDLSSVGQIHRDLGVLNPTRGPGVLPLSPDRGSALLDITGLIDHQHPVRITQVVHHVIAQVIADPVGVPHRATQQVLHAIRAGVPGVLGDSPAILTG